MSSSWSTAGRPAALTFALVFCLAWPAARPAAADPGEVQDSTFRSPRWGVTIDGPNDYVRAADSPYPGILARWEHASGASLSLAAQVLTRLRARPAHACGDNPLGRFVEDSLDALRASEYLVIQTPRMKRRSCRVVVAPARDRRAGTRVHQAYLVSGGIGYTLTLILPAGAAATRGADLDQALDRLELVTPEPRKTKPPEEPSQVPPDTGADRAVLPARFPDVKRWLPMPAPEPEHKESSAP